MENKNLNFIDSDITESIVKICFINKELDNLFDNNEVQKIKQFISCNKYLKNETDNLLSSKGIDEFKNNLQSIINFDNEMLMQSQKLAINFKNKAELVSLLNKLNQMLLNLDKKVCLNNLQ